MERIMAVYDVEPYYADRFADFANQKEKVPFSVVAFTTLEHLREYAKAHAIEILLISNGVPKEAIREIPAAQTVVLAEGEVVPVSEEYPSVYKYQSTDSIIREVLAYYCEKPVEEGKVMLGSRAKILGIYSPVSRCLKTSFAWTMGQQMAKNRKTLYISMEEFSGLSRLLGGNCQSDLSDVFYFYRQGNCSFIRLSSMIYTWGNLDYIPPVRYPEDLEQMNGEEMAGLLARIASETSYEIIVVDMGNLGRHAVPVMEICDVVYMPVKEDCISAAKLDEFSEYLEVSGKEHLKDRIQRLKLPYHSSFGRRDTYMEQLMWGELGDYVRQLLKGKD